MNNTDIIIKIQSVANAYQDNAVDFPLQRVCGFINVKDFAKIMTVAENKVNPRSATENKVVRLICETLNNSPELFWIKSRGILVATKSCQHLDRNRARLSFGDQDYEGIMDGGHNTLAIAKFIIETVHDGKVKIKDWNTCKQYWSENHHDIEAGIDEEMKEGSRFNFLIPIEIIAPLNEALPNVSSEVAMESEEYYRANLPDICTARNTNVQLKETAQGNQRELYKILKENIPDGTEVMWKPGEGDGVNSEDVIALACLPLLFLLEKNLLQLNTPAKLSPINIYSSKGKCVEFYKKVITDENVSTPENGEFRIHNRTVESALKLIKEIVIFYDKLYTIFPDMYNAVEGCQFGRIKSVKKDKKTTKSIPCWPHFGTSDKMCKYTYPEGFIYPLVCGITNLFSYNEETQTLDWIVSPDMLTLDDFKTDNAHKAYVSCIKLLSWDPQKIGKNEHSYDTASNLYKQILTRYSR